MQFLIDYLRSRRETVTQVWLHAVQTSPDFTTPDRIPVPQLVDHLPDLYDSLLECLQGEQAGEAADADARTHGRVRWQQEFRIDELLRELLLFRRVVMKEIDACLAQADPPLPPGERERLRHRAERFFEEGVVRSAEQFTTQFAAETERDRHILASLHQDALAEADQLQAVDAARLRLLRVIAHELRNLLNAANLTAVSLPNEKDPAWRDELHRMLSRSHRQMTDLVNQLLDIAPLLSGRETVDLELLHLTAFARQLAANFESMAAARKLGFRLEIEPGLDVIHTDGPKLQRIVTNLVQNAIKYTDEGEVVMGFSRSGEGGIEFSVIDSGPGIPPDQQEKIFEEFYRVPGSRRQEGTGLGLAIVRQLVELIGGSIRVESSPGQGAAFRVVFPDRSGEAGS